MEQEDPEPPHIKEELWTNQKGEPLQQLEEADMKFTLTPFTVKSEEDEEKPQLTQLHQSQTEEDSADFGGPEPARNFGPDGHLQPDPEDQNEDSCDTEEQEICRQRRLLNVLMMPEVRLHRAGQSLLTGTGKLAELVELSCSVLAQLVELAFPR
mgnify:CR=1 FL=1